MRFAPLLLVLAACPPSPAPMPPDATDAAPTFDGATSPCAEACAVLSSVCGPQPSDCVTVFARIDGHRLIRTPAGEALSCAAMAAAGNKAAVQALGVACP